MGGGGGGALILLLAVCATAELRTDAAATDSIRLWWLVSSPPGPPAPPPTVCVLDESSSSSSDETELASELDGVGEGGERVSCSCSIVRNSWIDSFRAHSWDSSDRSSCRRPYISLRKIASWVSSVVGFRTACWLVVPPPPPPLPLPLFGVAAMLLLLTVLLTGDWPRWDTSDAILTLCRLTPIGMNGFVGWWFRDGGRPCGGCGCWECGSGDCCSWCCWGGWRCCCCCGCCCWCC